MMNCEWTTPRGFYGPLHKRFGFTYDVAANSRNHKTPLYLDKAHSGLLFPWQGRVWCNPPYGRFEIPKWIQKACDEYSVRHCEGAVLLLPAYTDSNWFHDRVLRWRLRHEFFRGRLRFNNGQRGKARFASMIVIIGFKE